MSEEESLKGHPCLDAYENGLLGPTRVVSSAQSIDTPRQGRPG